MIASWLKKNCLKAVKNVLRELYWYGRYLHYKTMEQLFRACFFNLYLATGSLNYAINKKEA